MRKETKIIPTGSFQKDRGSSEMVMNSNFLPNISIEEIRTLELKSFDGEIILVENIDEFRKVIKRFENLKVLGFDTETRPSFRKGRRNKVSLVQLSGKNLACLFRINKLGIPDELRDILANPGIIKAGVALHDDIRFLGNVRKFQPAGFVDLQKLVKDYGIESSGLKKLTAIILGFRISKSQQVTDWEAVSLSEAQKLYAATDAWVCFEIYRKLVNYKQDN
jgi:ribonuclease D